VDLFGEPVDRQRDREFLSKSTEQIAGSRSMSEQAGLGRRGSMSWLRRFVSLVAAAAGMVFGGMLIFSADDGRAAEAPDSSELARFTVPAPAAARGQSATLLPDGRWMLAGGLQSGAASAAVFIQDEQALREPLRLQPLAGKMLQARSGHSATVLPDGSVLILGGVDANGIALGSAEIFDPLTGEITAIADTGLTPRSRHAATLLTDGYVLITGGVARDGSLLRNAELWNPTTQRAEPLANVLLAPRAEHSSALLPSGKGLIWDGTADGNQLPGPELFDPATSRFDLINAAEDALPPSYLNDATPRVEASLPEADAHDVDVTDRVAVRFSEPLQVKGVNARSVTLVGPAGAVEGKVVAAGSGLLLFFTPSVDLLPAATYTLFMQELTDRQGQPLAWTSFSFTTRGIAADPVPVVRAPGRSPIGVDTLIPEAKKDVQLTEAKKEKEAEKKKAKQPEPEKQSQPLDDDEFEDWIPGEHHRHGQWRVLGRKNEPRISKPLIPARALQAAAKATALSGRVARLNGRPLAGVRVSVGNASTVTDADGRFLLTGVPAGKRELTVDGSGAESGGRRYTKHFISVDVAPKRTTVLSQPIYLARTSTRGEISISSPAASDLVLTHPDIPGLELHISKGTVLRTPDGKIVTKLAIVPLPVDRAPFAVPDGFPVYFTVQPAGVFVDNSATGTAGGIRVVYPNYIGAAPGTRVTFWNYDPKGEGWQVYGQGTVSQDGRQVIPDPDIVQRDLMAFGYALENTGNDPADAPRGKCKKGDPVDCGTGLFLHQVTDLFVTDTLPIGITRTYRPKDPKKRDFGIGTSHNYALFLSNPTGETVPPAVDLILPDGGRVRFEKIAGTWLDSVVYRHSSTPTEWFGATLQMNVPADRWQITTRDKTVYDFSDHSPSTLTAIRDRNGNAITITRTNTGGKIEQVRSSNGRALKFLHDTSNRITEIKDNSGRIVKYEYDQQGRLVRVTDPDRKVERYTYDSSNRMTSVIDRRGNTMVTNVYDANSRVSQQTLADGAVWQFAYTLNAAGRVVRTTVTDPRNFVEQLDFNEDGYLTQIISALGQPEQQVMTFVREPLTNLLMSTTDALGRVDRFTYNSVGRISSVVRAVGTTEEITETFSYEPNFSNLAAYTDPLNHQTQLDYDGAGNLVSITDPQSHVSTVEYDAHGQPIKWTNPVGKVTQVDYEGGDVSAVTDPLGRVSSSVTDSAGRVIVVTDPFGNRTRAEYDAMDRVVRSTDARGGVTAMTYDAHGNPLTIRDARDVASHVYTYDVRDRVKTYTDPLGKTETYNYDGMSNLTSKVNRKNQTTTYTYDALNRLKMITYADSSTVTVTWDAGNRPRQFADSTNGTITHEYDNLDRLTREVSPQGQVDYEYDAAGRRAQFTVSGKAPVTYVYDAADRLTQIAQGMTAVGFTYDDAGRRNTITLPNGVVGTYAFNDADQLRSIAYAKNGTAVGDVSYTYDLAGRRIGFGGSLAKQVVSATVPSATYDAANRLTNWGGAVLGYDDQGNLTSFGSRTFAWNARDELVSSSSGSSTFAYDVMGRRTSRVASGTTTSYLHDGLNPAVVNNDFMLEGLGLDEIYARVDVSGTTTFVPDALGSTRLLTDASGSATASYAYAPYGEVSKTGSDDTAFRFTGREHDGDANLDYFRARYYSPELGRFISEDPIGLAAGMNLYGYVEGDPVSLTDPTGECPWCVAAGIGALTDLAVQLYFNGFDLKCVDWKEVAISGAAAGLGVGIAQKLGKISTVFGGNNRPTYRFFQIKGRVRVESHPISRRAPDWYSYPHWHPDFLGKPWSKMHWPVVEPAVGIPAAAYNATKDDCRCQQ
jgi:RHS repeat-associated protein